LVLPSEVVPPLIPIADLTRMSSDEEQMEELELGVSEALGISLSEVQAWYFQDSDQSRAQDLESECEYEHWLDEWVEECRLQLQSYREDTMF
jgi:hypothetical protein